MLCFTNILNGVFLSIIKLLWFYNVWKQKNARILKYLHGYDFVYVYICLCVCAVNNMCHSNLFIQANLSPHIYKLILLYIYAFVYMYCYNISVIVLLCIWSGFSFNSLLLYTCSSLFICTCSLLLFSLGIWVSLHIVVCTECTDMYVNVQMFCFPMLVRWCIHMYVWKIDKKYFAWFLSIYCIYL